MTPTLEWSGGEMEFPELLPPYRLQAGFDACREIEHAIFLEALPRTRGAILEWADRPTAAPERRRRHNTVAAAVQFLDGMTLDRADDVYAARHHEHLATAPEPLAARFVIRAIVARERDARWRGDLPPVVVGWLSRG